jgi:TolB-like protein/Tfp pilus assembly protein PilF
MGFWARVREHKVIQWGIAYLGAALALGNGVELVGQTLDWPDGVARVFVIALIVGFPIALTVAWYHGHKGMQQVTAAELWIISVLVLIGALLFTAVLQPQAEQGESVVSVAGSRGSEPVAGLGSEPRAPAAPLERREVLPNSVAVLPLENLSPDPDNAFFASGMHGEIIGQLTKLKSLTVISRDSVLRYAQSRPPLQQIAAELGVEALLTGSIQYAGDRISVGIALVDPVSGANLWSESYVGELAEIFAVQADISMNVANALDAEFSAEEQALIEEIPTASSEAYEVYLQARALRPLNENDPRIVPLLEQAIDIDPGFAAAHAFLANHLSRMLSSSTVGNAVDVARRAELAALVERHAVRALEIDEHQGPAHAALATLAFLSWRWTEAEAAFRRAIDSSPEDAVVTVYFVMLLSYLGDHDEARMIAERANTLNPSVIVPLGYARGYARDYDTATAVFRRAVQNSPVPGSRLWLAFMEIARGNDAEALNLLELVDRMTADNGLIVYLPELAYGFARVGQEAKARRLFDEIKAREAEGAPAGAGVWAMAHLAIGDREGTLEWLEVGAQEAANHEPDPGFIALMNLKMNITNDPVLREPEFAAVLERIRGD